MESSQPQASSPPKRGEQQAQLDVTCLSLAKGKKKKDPPIANQGVLYEENKEKSASSSVKEDSGAGVTSQDKSKMKSRTEDGTKIIIQVMNRCGKEMENSESRFLLDARMILIYEHDVMTLQSASQPGKVIWRLTAEGEERGYREDHFITSLAKKDTATSHALDSLHDHREPTPGPNCPNRYMSTRSQPCFMSPAHREKEKGSSPSEEGICDLFTEEDISQAYLMIPLRQLNPAKGGSQFLEMEDHNCKNYKLPVNPKIVQDVLLQLDPYNSMEPKGIHPRVLKELADEIANLSR
ncbi:hypothetical protein DUI87_03725 [Hirundo rustica rustica]|uniref:Uncharacterized protein n=1 Tax=Hirundo rustica rustica TaxID=333673 RepID=A0A3M0L299_HIRRU|nr:hypothetical protein DUI87_03725 [Hirundo rustica rustica]